MNLQEWKLLSSIDYTKDFRKLLKHLKDVFISGCSKEQITDKSFYVELAFGFNRQSIEIKYQEQQGYFSVQIKERKTNQIMYDFAQTTWKGVLLELQQKGYIRDPKLCEQLSTIDEFNLYKDLWE